MVTACEIEVSVHEGPTLVQTWPCSVTTMPDGSSGVIWRGTAYKLLPGNRIDVSPNLAGSGPSHLVVGGEEASWILIRGTAAVLRKSEVALMCGGIVVSRSGRWLGEPVGEVVFDWFIRSEGALDPATIAGLLLEPAPSTSAVDPEARRLVLEQRIASLLAEVARLKQAGNQDVAHRTRALTPGRLAVNDSSDEADVRDNPARHSAEPAAAPARVEARRAAPRPRLSDELLRAFQELRPDLKLLRSSLIVAMGEYPSRDGFYQAIQDLPSSGARPDGWKKLRGADRWWERHVSTGQDDKGRVYARFDTDKRQWSLLLGWKSDQEADITWIRNQ